MKIFRFIAFSLALSACDQDLSSRSVVTIGGREFAVYEMRGQPGTYYASPADRSAAFSPFPGIRAGNISAIEAVSGCTVIPGTAGLIDNISTEASVRC